MARDPNCPKCGRPMLPATGGSFCPSCGTRVSAAEQFSDGPPTPAMGIPRPGLAGGRTTLPGGGLGVPTSGSPPSGAPAPAELDYDGPRTMLYSRGFDQADESTTDPLDRPAGGSIFESNLSLEAVPGGEPTGAVWPDAQPAPSEYPTVRPASGAEPFPHTEATAVMPDPAEEARRREREREREEEREREREREDERRRDAEEAKERSPDSEHPGSLGALLLPRCRKCNRVLELEDVTAGECGECRGVVAPARRRAERRRAGGPSLVRPDNAITGTLAAAAATWAGVLVILSAVRSDPGTWGTQELVLAGTRMAFVLFAIAVAILWACGRPWAGGAAFALGAAGAAFAAAMVRTDALHDDLAAASAWMLGGLAGAAAALSAALPRSESLELGLWRLKRSPIRNRAGRRPRDTEELLAGSRRSGRSRRRRRRNVSRARAVVGGLVALAGAGFAGWQVYLAVGADPSSALMFGPAAFRIWGLGVASLVGAALALWLFIHPPEGRTQLLALAAAVVVGPLPVWLAAGAGAASLAGEAASSSAADDFAAGVLTRAAALEVGLAKAAVAIPKGLARVLSVEALAAGVPNPVPFDVRAGAGGAALVAFAASLLVLMGKARARGKGLAGFALAWSLMWGAGLAAALVR